MESPSSIVPSYSLFEFHTDNTDTFQMFLHGCRHGFPIYLISYFYDMTTTHPMSSTSAWEDLFIKAVTGVVCN